MRKLVALAMISCAPAAAAAEMRVAIGPSSLEQRFRAIQQEHRNDLIEHQDRRPASEADKYIPYVTPSDPCRLDPSLDQCKARGKLK
jgi:hypothetical protein